MNQKQDGVRLSKPGDVDFAVVGKKVVLSKDGVHFALTLPQIDQLEQLIPWMKQQLSEEQKCK